MSLYEEFPDIAVNGNAAGRAQGAYTVAVSSVIVTSLVDAVLTPLSGLVLGQSDLSNLFVGMDNPNSVAVLSSPSTETPGTPRLLSVCSSMTL